VSEVEVMVSEVEVMVSEVEVMVSEVEVMVSEVEPPQTFLSLHNEIPEFNFNRCLDLFYFLQRQ
jgi:hypothetical protein